MVSIEQKFQDQEYLSTLYFSRGNQGMSSSETRALGEQNSPKTQGFFLAPSKFSKTVQVALQENNPLRANGAQVFTDVGYSFNIPWGQAANPANTVRNASTGEIAFPETTVEFNLPINSSATPTKGLTLYPKPRTFWFVCSQELLEDATEQVMEYLATIVGQGFADSELKQSLHSAGTGAITDTIPVGLCNQLNNTLRVNMGNIGTVASSFTSLELAANIAALSSESYSRAIWIMHPLAVGVLDLASLGGWLKTVCVGPENTPQLTLAGRPLYLSRNASANSLLSASAIAGVLVDPTKWIIAESNSAIQLRRLDEPLANNGQVVFQAYRRIDHCLATIESGYAMKF